MNISLVSKKKEHLHDFQNILEQYGFQLVTKNPDFVISHGGDGTLLIAERLYPGKPKIPIRDSSICKKCYANAFEEIVDLLQKKKYTIQTHSKLQATFQKKQLIGLNDIIIRNMLPTSAIRFDLIINNDLLGSFIGDGIVVATPFGSTGYFHSITHTSFTEGLGIAINNSTTLQKPLLLKESTSITFLLKRGIAHLSADNDPRIIKLKTGSRVTIQLSKKKASIIHFKK